MPQKSSGVAGAGVIIPFALKPKNSAEVIYTDTRPNGSLQVTFLALYLPLLA